MSEPYDEKALFDFPSEDPVAVPPPLTPPIVRPAPAHNRPRAHKVATPPPPARIPAPGHKVAAPPPPPARVPAPAHKVAAPPPPQARIPAPGHTSAAPAAGRISAPARTRPEVPKPDLARLLTITSSAWVGFARACRQSSATILQHAAVAARHINARLARTRVTLPRLPAAITAAFCGGVLVGALAVWLLAPGADAPGATLAAAQAAAVADLHLSPERIVPPVATTGTTANADDSPAPPVSAPPAPPRQVPAAATPAVTQRTPAAPPAVARTGSSAAPASTGSNGRFLGSLTVRSEPSGATVFINGRSVGRTPIVLANQPAGSRAVRLTLDGYESWSSAVRVVANQENVITADLHPR